MKNLLLGLCLFMAQYIFAKTAPPDSLWVAVSLDQMNIFHLGLENPITVAACGSEAKMLKLTCSGCTVRHVGGPHYRVRCQKPGRAILHIEDTQTGQYRRLHYRVKRLPNPTVRLGRHYHGGVVPTPVFKMYQGLQAVIENMDVDARCGIVSYTLYYTHKNQDVVQLKGEGGRFTGVILDLVQQAQPGDVFSFTDLRVRCPGDEVARPVSGLSILLQ